MSSGSEARDVAPPDEGLSPEGHEQAVSLIMSFRALEQVGKLYDMNNELVQRVLGDMLGTVQALGAEAEAVSLTLSGYSFFLNHQLIRMDFTKYQKAQQLRDVWQRLGIDEAIFPADLSHDGLEEFSGKVVARLSRQEQDDSLFDRAWGGVTVRRVVGDDEAGEDARPVHEVAGRIYCVLVALTEQLMARLQEAKPAPVLQLKQALQAAIDHMEAHEDMMVALATTSPLPPSVATHLVNTSLLSVLLGQKLEFRRRELMALATAAIFHDQPKAGLNEGTLSSLERPGKRSTKDRSKIASHWLKTARGVVQESNLTEDALGRLVVLFESQLEFSRDDLYRDDLYRGKATHKGRQRLWLLSRIIAVCDAYDTLTWARPGKKTLLPHAALMRLVEAGDRRHEPALLKLFVGAVGVYPAGSAVHLEGGELAVVLRQNRGAPTRPVVRVVLDADDSPADGPVIDLTSKRKHSILGHADAAALGINLAGSLGE